MKKITKKQKELISDIEHLLSISLFDKVVARHSSRKYVTIEIYDLSENDVRNIKRIGYTSSRYTIEANGYKMIAIRLK